MTKERVATDATPIARLKALAGDPERQAGQALEMLERPAATFDVQAAVRALGALRDPTYRPRLLELYRHYDADGVRRDAGGTLRIEVLRALRGVAVPDDAPLFEHAAVTEEFLPPGPAEVCAGLRAAGVVALASVDDDAASLHAVRLLRHRHTDTLGGEPALTSARLLAAQGRVLPLYDYVLHADPRVPEVAQECLKALVGLPPVLMADLLGRYDAGSDPVELVGLFDLVLARPERDEYGPTIGRYLETLESEDVFRYLATVIMADRKGALGQVVLEHARWEMRPGRAVILLEALELRAGDEEVDEVRTKLTSRVNA